MLKSFLFLQQGWGSNWRFLESFLFLQHRLLFAAVTYFLWQERNFRLHSNKQRHDVGLARQIGNSDNLIISEQL